MPVKHGEEGHAGEGLDGDFGCVRILAMSSLAAMPNLHFHSPSLHARCGENDALAGPKVGLLLGLWLLQKGPHLGGPPDQWAVGYGRFTEPKLSLSSR